MLDFYKAKGYRSSFRIKAKHKKSALKIAQEAELSIKSRSPTMGGHGLPFYSQMGILKKPIESNEYEESQKT